MTTQDKGSNENIRDSMEQTSQSAAKPLPLPAFSFNPGADLPAQRAESPTHPVLQEMAMNQQRVSRSARPAPLPPFTFIPHTGSSNNSPSPTRSGFIEVPSSAGSGMGHRRRGSEFVGGGIGGTQLISASPEKPEYRPPPVSGPPRGHSHRRSQAVSISDIDTSNLIKANAVSKANAASPPTTPLDTPQGFSFPRNSPPGRQSISDNTPSPPASPRRRDSAPGFRPRVGFAERVDVIPRPLSMISSETDCSTSTIRGHSVSGSINSIASPGPRAPSNLSSPVPIEVEEPLERPRTADPAMLLFSESAKADKSMSMISLPKRPLSASGSPVGTESGSSHTKRRHFWFSHSNHSSPTPTPRVEREDPITTVLPPVVASPAEEATHPRTSRERKLSVKQRKYHTWTSGIFSKKGSKRAPKMKAKRTPTPPTLTRRTSDRINTIFDQDDTIVLREPSPTATRSRPISTPTLLTVASISPATEPGDVTSPMLDLDAALADDERGGHDTPTRSAASRMAKLHSAERRGGVDAFGSFHKRAESAPTMQPVSQSIFGMHRLGSNISLTEEVFDEEEEDNFLAGNIDLAEPGSTADFDTSSRPADGTSDRKPSATSFKSVDGLGLQMQTNSSDGIMIADPEDDVAEIEQRSSKSTIEAPILPDDLLKRPATAPMCFQYPAPRSQYASSTEGRTTSPSVISSPDPDHVTFDNFPRANRFLGEPNQDMVLRVSNDDLPSLTDSLSTGAIARISSSANTRSSVEQRIASTEQRSASVCMPATSKSNNPNWKRASLASLNRLIPGSANGSRLKFETVADFAAKPEIKDKDKHKSNRISKLMHFWRSKQTTDG